MIELFTPKSMRAIDAKLIGQLGISGITLMENAAKGVADRTIRIIDNKNTDAVFVLCGPGNNGGDGFATAAFLHDTGYTVYIVLLSDPEKYKDDALYEYQRALNEGCGFLSKEAYLSQLTADSVVVDALFGTGLSREISKEICDLIKQTNDSGAYILSVDIPSGLNGTTGEIMGSAFSAMETVTFGAHKIGLLTENGRMHAGMITVHPITEMRTDDICDAYLLEKSDIVKMLPERPLNSHKGKNGRALIIGGCDQYKGAVKMCTAAALRGGSGLLSVAVPTSVASAFYDLPEAMCVPVGCLQNGEWNVSATTEAEKLIAGKNAVAIGPGMGKINDSCLFENLLTSGIPTVIDADGLNHIAIHRELIDKLNKKIVLTPHPVELSRLLECGADDVLRDPSAMAMRAAKELNCIVILKGATSYISDGEKLYLNITGNPGLAKGGSGDTLTGLVLAMLSQGLTPLDAACAGAYLLGATAEHALEILGNRMLLAGDVIDLIRETAEGIRL